MDDYKQRLRDMGLPPERIADRLMGYGEADRLLREQGWLDPYEVETMTAMSHGQGMAEARAEYTDLVRRLMDTQHPAVSTPHGYLCACQTHTDARAALAAPAPPSEAEARLRDAAAVSYSFADRQPAPPPADEWRAYERGEGVLFTPPAGIDAERLLSDWIESVRRDWREHWEPKPDHRYGRDFEAFLGERLKTDLLLHRFAARLAPQPTERHSPWRDMTPEEWDRARLISKPAAKGDDDEAEAQFLKPIR